MTNPYELRLNVVAMAKALLDKEHDVKLMEYSNETQAVYSALGSSGASYNSEHALKAIRAIKAPTAPTPEEVVAKADVLYSFVNDRK